MTALLLCCFSLYVQAQGTSSPRTKEICAPDLYRDITRTPDRAFAVIVQTQTTGRKREVPSLLANRQLATPLDSAGTYLAQLNGQQISLLATEKSVWHISPDRPLYAAQDYLTQAVGADVAGRVFGISGQKIAIAVLDTGVYAHPDLTPNLRLIGWKDMVADRPAPYDDNGHGTHVAGIAAGNGAMSVNDRYNVNMTRVAPGAQIVGVKVLDRNGAGLVSTVVSAIDWVIANRSTLKIRILNLSLGQPVAESFQTDPLCQAAERAWKSGILVVCAAGNFGRSVPNDPTSAPAYGTIASPGNDPYVLTVGAMNTVRTATRSDDRIASYSSRGPSAIDFVLKPDVVAPGNRIDSLATPGSTLFTQHSDNWIDPAQFGGSGQVQYYTMSGTSMAAPVVSAAAALMLQRDPTLNPDTIKARLMLTAEKGKSTDRFTYGAGYINIPAALTSRVVAPLGAISPKTYIDKDGYVWIDNAMWGNNRVWGENAMWGNNRMACNAIWGNCCWNDNRIAEQGVWGGDAAPSSESATADLLAVLLKGD